MIRLRCEIGCRRHIHLMIAQRKPVMWVTQTGHGVVNHLDNFFNHFYFSKINALALSLLINLLHYSPIKRSHSFDDCPKLVKHLNDFLYFDSSTNCIPFTACLHGIRFFFHNETRYVDLSPNTGKSSESNKKSPTPI